MTVIQPVGLVGQSTPIGVGIPEIWEDYRISARIGPLRNILMEQEIRW